MCESIWEWKVVIHSAVGVMSHVQYVVSVHLVWCLQSVVRAELYHLVPYDAHQSCALPSTQHYSFYICCFNNTHVKLPVFFYLFIFAFSF